MSSPTVVLKNPKGWFAAGVEISQAMMVLSDGAFKVFVYLCLNARRDSGMLHMTQTELARNLKKAHGTIRKCLNEMQEAGICKSCFGHNPGGQGTIQITDRYWPYRKGDNPQATEDADAYIAEVRKLLDARACIRQSFSTSDEILARSWFSSGIPLDRIAQAILMGCHRKYTAWRNNQRQFPIASLSYFLSILIEIEAQSVPAEYWDYVRFRLQRVEKLWIESYGKNTDPQASAPAAM